MKKFLIDYTIQASDAFAIDQRGEYQQINFAIDFDDAYLQNKTADNLTINRAYNPDPSSTEINVASGSKSISGNLLDSPTSELTTIENYAIAGMMDENGILEITHIDNFGILYVFTKTLEEGPNSPQKGDFLYVFKEENLRASTDDFSYQIKHSDGTFSHFKLSLIITEPAPYIGESEDSRVDEAGLLPGDHESSETYGNLDISFIHLEKYSLKFDPIQQQTILLNANLTSSQIPLVYEILDNGKLLQATKGSEGPIVFSVQLHLDGSYQFKLHQPIDRDPLENLIVDTNFESITASKKVESGWQLSNSDMFTLQNEKIIGYETIISQFIPTEQGAPYHLSFFQGCPFAENNPIAIYWNNNLLKTFQGKKNWTGYYFMVEGAPGLLSELKIVTNSDHAVDEYLRDFSLYSNATQQLPLEFSFSLMNEDLPLASSQFTVLVALESPLILQPTEPLNIVYEQGIYQSIVIQEANANFPLTTLNLEALFNNLQITQSNRQVDVVQLKENGIATPIYEIQLNDTKQPLSLPITVADVRLMFEGGEGGLDVFFKNIQILDS